MWVFFCLYSNFEDDSWSFFDENELPDLVTEQTNEITSCEDIVPGHRVVNIAHFLQQVQKLNDHRFTCSMGRFELAREVRRGLHSTLVFKCHACHAVSRINTNDDKINEQLVWGALSTGIGYSQTEEFMNILGVPIMADKIFRAKEKEIGEVNIFNYYKSSKY